MRYLCRLLVPLALLIPSVGVLSATSVATAQSQAKPAATVPPDDPARGMRYQGLKRGRPDGPCGRLFEVDVTLPGGPARTACTHGPDPAPPGFDVQTPAAPAAPAPPAASTAAAGGLACLGNGTDGYRVQAIYARASDRADRFGQFRSSFASYVAGIDAALNASAAETGSEQHVRWVTDASCQPVIQQALLTSSGDDSFDSTIKELRTLGFTASNRKYLVFVDANVYCGIGEIWNDDRATTTPGANYNNGHPQVQGTVARVDSGCWGASVAAHELMHNLGGVQQSAPHVTPGWHCTDDYDRMCYDDDGSGPVRMQQICPVSQEERFDCNHDDYYSTRAAPGSYLATHWNTANSAFLTPPVTMESPQAEVADFDGNGSTDAAVFRPGNGTWFVRNGTTQAWGANGDVPVPADYDGDRRTDLAVYRPASGLWFVKGSAGTNTTQAWGVLGDIPVPGDYDGDGRADLAVYRATQGVWFVNGSTGASTSHAWGASGDIPVPADYDGDGRADLAVYRATQGVWFVNGSTGASTSHAWGASGDIPVPGHYDGDNRADLAVHRPAQGVWFVNGSAGSTVTEAWGASGDVPVPGDYDASGTGELAMYRPAQGLWFVRNGTTAAWGAPGDIPLSLPAAVLHLFFVL